MTSLHVVSARTWQNELADSLRAEAELAQALALRDDERAAIRRLADEGGLPLGITPHYLSLIDPLDENDPLRRQLVPSLDEYRDDPFARADPLGEESLEVVPNLVHRYPDRVLLLATDRCASYCRFCTRKRLVGQGPTPTFAELDRALDYVAGQPAVREVIVSGGDALTLSDGKLETLLSRIRSIPHVEIIRLATRMLAFAPTRVTDGLLDVIRRHHPVYVLTHFNHPRELPEVTRDAITRLVDAGVPVLNQTVLLQGVNDDATVLAELFRTLTRLRARPYYLHQCDVAPGTAAFRVPLERALAIVSELRGHVSGLSVPTFVIDIPGGKGKVPMYNDPIIDRDDESVELRGFSGETARYPTT